MNDHDINTDEAKRAAQAIWQFVVSLKSLRKRDGSLEDFQTEKLERSISAAFQSVGKQDEFLVRSLAEQIYARLQEQFDGAIIPTVDQVRETVVATLIEQGEQDVATHYRQFISTKAKKLTLPITPPMPITSPVRDQHNPELSPPRRRRLNEERKAVTHKFQVGTHEGYLTVGLYDDGQPGEIFLKMSKEGSVMSGLMDAFATAVSIGLQYGVPLKVLVNKFTHMRFEPSGATQNPNIPTARSIVDYIFRWLSLKFLTPEDRQSIGIFGNEDRGEEPNLLGVLNVDGSRQSKLLDPTENSSS